MHSEWLLLRFYRLAANLYHVKKKKKKSRARLGFAAMVWNLKLVEGI